MAEEAPQPDEQPIPEGVTPIEAMTEEEMVDEIVRRHGVPKYGGKKVETTHWLKNDLQNLTFACRRVENAAHEDDRLFEGMTDEDVEQELNHRGVKFQKNNKRETRIRKLQEARVKFAMVSAGHDEYTEAEKAAMAGLPVPPKGDDRDVIVDGDAPQPPADGGDGPDPVDPESAAAASTDGDPLLQPPATTTLSPSQRLHLADARRELVDQLMEQFFTDDVAIDVLTAFRSGRDVKLQAKLILGNGKSLEQLAHLRPPPPKG